MKRINIAFAAAAVALSFACTSLAQMRYVVVNGQLLHPQQAAQIESLFCSPIACRTYRTTRSSRVSPSRTSGILSAGFSRTSPAKLR